MNCVVRKLLRRSTATVASIVLAGTTLATMAATEKSPSAADTEFFEKRIRPLLADRCVECHSESRKVKGGFNLDTRDSLLKGGDSGRAIVPGKPDESLLIKAVRYASDDLQMPPKHRLSPDQVTDLETWVKMGAPDPRVKSAPSTPSSPLAPERTNHWAFQPVRNPPVPSVRTTGWARDDIDRFILARLEARNLAPNPEADRQTWIRRATFDLTGLPPTPQEIDAFLADTAPDAFARVVDRLLASPRYGERWGRHWLDVVRYADTAGDSSDYPIPQARRYRDYVIQSFNQDRPYDQFLREQLAGDLLPGDDEAARRERMVATGYIALARRFGVNPENVQHLTIEDTIDNLGKATLGLSLGCARCHDHKYDPVTTADYYGLYGIFASTRYPFAGSENEKKQRDLVPLISAAEIDAILAPHREHLDALDAEVKRLEADRDALRAAQKAAENPAVAKPSGESAASTKARTLTDVREDIRKAREKRDAYVKKLPDYDRAFAVMDGTPKNARIQIRGEPGKPGDEVPRRFLAVFGGQPLPPGTAGSGRRELADWIASADNPLTARVLVNRVWQHHFGRALVQTPNDFGLRGKPPTHPELLDHLASRFLAGGWSIKRLHRAILLSAVYRQSSDDREGALVADPGNDLLWKFSRQRLDAEAIRDTILATSGTLEPPTAAAHPFPPQEKWNYTQHRPFDATYPSRQRSVYLMQQRIKKHPYLELFDGADPNSSTATRILNTTPLQALFMMNDPFLHDQADQLGRRLLTERTGEDDRLTLAYQLTLGRPPSREELDSCHAHLTQYAAKLRTDGRAGDEIERRSWASLARVLISSNEFVYLD